MGFNFGCDICSLGTEGEVIVARVKKNVGGEELRCTNIKKSMKCNYNTDADSPPCKHIWKWGRASRVGL